MAEQDIKAQAQQIVEKVKEIVKEGNASRIFGAVIGLSAAPFVVLASALVSFGLDCEIEIEKKDGTIINLNNTEIGSKLENAKSEVKDKAKEFFANMETKGEDVEIDIEDVDIDDAE